MCVVLPRTASRAGPLILKRGLVPPPFYPPGGCRSGPLQIPHDEGVPPVDPDQKGAFALPSGLPIEQGFHGTPAPPPDQAPGLSARTNARTDAMRRAACVSAKGETRLSPLHTPSTELGDAAAPITARAATASAETARCPRRSSRVRSGPACTARCATSLLPDAGVNAPLTRPCL